MQRGRWRPGSQKWQTKVLCFCRLDKVVQHSDSLCETEATPSNKTSRFRLLLLVCTWRHVGTKLHFHLNTSRKNYIALTLNMAALSQGCKSRIHNVRDVSVLVVQARCINCVHDCDNIWSLQFFFNDSYNKKYHNSRWLSVRAFSLISVRYRRKLRQVGHCRGQSFPFFFNCKFTKIHY